MGALMGAALALLGVVWMVLPNGPPPQTPVVGEFQPWGDGWSVRFDTADRAIVDIIVKEHGGRLVVQGHMVGVQKGQWSTGDGAYSLRIAHPGALIVSSLGGIEDLGELMAAAQRDLDPLDSLASRIQAIHPDAGLAISPNAL
jgi:hypothetical protein